MKEGELTVETRIESSILAIAQIVRTIVAGVEWRWRPEPRLAKTDAGGAGERPCRTCNKVSALNVRSSPLRRGDASEPHRG